MPAKNAVRLGLKPVILIGTFHRPEGRCSHKTKPPSYTGCRKSSDTGFSYNEGSRVTTVMPLVVTR